MGFLIFEHVHLAYQTEKGEIPVLEDITLQVEPGEFITIVGPSGCGKSTLLKLAAGIVTPSRGEVLFEDGPTEDINPKAGMMFQDPHLFPWLSVKRNIEFGPKRKGMKREEREALVTNYLEQMGLSDFANNRSYELSGGMKQRAALARTLINDPEVLLMDEPFGALDKLTKDNMQLLIQDLWKRTGKTFLFVTHDVEEAVKLGTRLIVMSQRPGSILGEISIKDNTDNGDLRDKVVIMDRVYQLLADS